MVAQGLRVRDLIVEAGGDTCRLPGSPTQVLPTADLALGPCSPGQAMSGLLGSVLSSLFLSSGLCVSECGEGSHGAGGGHPLGRHLPPLLLPQFHVGAHLILPGKCRRWSWKHLVGVKGCAPLPSTCPGSGVLQGGVGWGGWTGREPLRWVRWESEVGGPDPAGA